MAGKYLRDLVRLGKYLAVDLSWDDHVALIDLLLDQVPNGGHAVREVDQPQKPGPNLFRG